MSKHPEHQAAQGLFDFVMPYSESRRLLSVREVCAVIRREKDFVYELCENGRLEYHKDSASGGRESYRITRRSVLLYLADTAKYEPEDFSTGLATLAKSLTTPQLVELQGLLGQILRARS